MKNKNVIGIWNLQSRSEFRIMKACKWNESNYVIKLSYFHSDEFSLDNPKNYLLNCINNMRILNEFTCIPDNKRGWQYHRRGMIAPAAIELFKRLLDAMHITFCLERGIWFFYNVFLVPLLNWIIARRVKHKCFKMSSIEHEYMTCHDLCYISMYQIFHSIALNYISVQNLLYQFHFLSVLVYSHFFSDKCLLVNVILSSLSLDRVYVNVLKLIISEAYVHLYVYYLSFPNNFAT